MTKQELTTLLQSLGIPVAEGIQSDKDAYTYPRIVFWDYVWEPLTASGDEYDTNVTYQISFFGSIPRDPKLIELKTKLNQKNIFPMFQHEYIDKDKCFHTFLAVEVLEKIG